MSNDPRHRIVVGVDGSAASVQAVRWAAVQARLRMSAIELVFVGPDDEASAALLREAAAAAGEDLDVTTDVAQGGVAERLVSVAEGADMLVVARGRSVCAEVVASARCAVVVVPPSRRG